ncbi:serine protease S53 [Heterobasidion irregulare TC 32-1]|uniref:Serine protease S53 n=1 Tax=Heterobasidion irregulare (strain TC 32-1) TaxID=747525 RepID=W4KK20_HETIT|nr:serine protease S53 [Heterobasidion irregulare TC 32-1]ETW85386.1 serine protease S53 [Heterobasidion irregulare TC 32-1]
MLLQYALHLFVLESFIAVALASPLRDFAVKHSWSTIPAGWEYHGTPPPHRAFPLRIGLKQNRVDELISALYEISDPFHEKYGRHLSKNEVEALLFLPPLPISTIERMLSASFLSYRHASSGMLATRTLSYSPPRHLHAHIDVVHPTTVFNRLQEMRATFKLEDHDVTVGDITSADIPASCNTTITPACLQALYRTEGYIPAAANKGNSIEIAGYLEQVGSLTFFRRFQLDAVGANVTVRLVDGGLNDQSIPGTGAGLDVQYTEGLTFSTPNVYYSTPGTTPTINDSATPPQRDEPYLNWLNFVLSQTDIPFTYTTSYGGDDVVNSGIASRVCSTFAQLGARGSSVTFSSGDGGVGAGTCQMNNGTNRTIFQPAGFSVYFSRPEYHAKVVPPFLESLGATYASLFNPTGRAVPDISTQGEGFQVIVNGTVHSVGGTSASSPTFAGIVTLLDDLRLANGKPPLGFLNPMLYSTGLPGFTDILSGNNPGCGTPGFYATIGWDAVTGLGTPDFSLYSQHLYVNVTEVCR